MEQKKNRVFIVKEDDNNRRIDRIIRKMFPNTGLSQIYKYLRKGDICINDKKIKQNHRVKINDKISMMETIAEELQKSNPVDKITINYKSRINILFENKDILAVNKPAELRTHGISSLNDMVLEYLSAKIKSSLSFKPGPAHRLDTNTTGIICFSKSLVGAQYLTYCFKNNCFNKYYIALTDGEISRKIIWKDSIIKENNKSVISNNQINAITTVYPVLSNYSHSLIICKIETGKYHQIRCQSSYHNHPLTGDKKYKGSNHLNSYILHSAKISVKDSDSINHQFKAIEAPLPEKSKKLIESIFGSNASELLWNMVSSI